MDSTAQRISTLQCSDDYLPRSPSDCRFASPPLPFRNRRAVAKRCGTSEMSAMGRSNHSFRSMTRSASPPYLLLFLRVIYSLLDVLVFVLFTTIPITLLFFRGTSSSIGDRPSSVSASARARHDSSINTNTATPKTIEALVSAWPLPIAFACAQESYYSSEAGVGAGGDGGDPAANPGGDGEDDESYYYTTTTVATIGNTTTTTRRPTTAAPTPTPCTPFDLTLPGGAAAFAPSVYVRGVSANATVAQGLYRRVCFPNSTANPSSQRLPATGRPSVSQYAEVVFSFPGYTSVSSVLGLMDWVSPLCVTISTPPVAIPTTTATATVDVLDAAMLGYCPLLLDTALPVVTFYLRIDIAGADGDNSTNPLDGLFDEFGRPITTQAAGLGGRLSGLPGANRSYDYSDAFGGAALFELQALGAAARARCAPRRLQSSFGSIRMVAPFAFWGGSSDATSVDGNANSEYEGSVIGTGAVVLGVGLILFIAGAIVGCVTGSPASSSPFPAAPSADASNSSGDSTSRLAWWLGTRRRLSIGLARVYSGLWWHLVLGALPGLLFAASRLLVVDETLVPHSDVLMRMLPDGSVEEDVSYRWTSDGRGLQLAMGALGLALFLPLVVLAPLYVWCFVTRVAVPVAYDGRGNLSLRRSERMALLSMTSDDENTADDEGAVCAGPQPADCGAASNAKQSALPLPPPPPTAVVMNGGAAVTTRPHPAFSIQSDPLLNTAQIAGGTSSSQLIYPSQLPMPPPSVTPPLEQQHQQHGQEKEEEVLAFSPLAATLDDGVGRVGVGNDNSQQMQHCDHYRHVAPSSPVRIVGGEEAQHPNQIAEEGGATKPATVMPERVPPLPPPPSSLPNFANQHRSLPLPPPPARTFNHFGSGDWVANSNDDSSPSQSMSVSYTTPSTPPPHAHSGAVVATAGGVAATATPQTCNIGAVPPSSQQRQRTTLGFSDDSEFYISKVPAAGAGGVPAVGPSFDRGAPKPPSLTSPRSQSARDAAMEANVGLTGNGKVLPTNGRDGLAVVERTGSISDADSEDAFYHGYFYEKEDDGDKIPLAYPSLVLWFCPSVAVLPHANRRLYGPVAAWRVPNPLLCAYPFVAGCLIGLIAGLHKGTSLDDCVGLYATMAVLMVALCVGTAALRPHRTLVENVASVVIFLLTGVELWLAAMLSALGESWEDEPISGQADPRRDHLVDALVALYAIHVVLTVVFRIVVPIGLMFAEESMMADVAYREPLCLLGGEGSSGDDGSSSSSSSPLVVLANGGRRRRQCRGRNATTGSCSLQPQHQQSSHRYAPLTAKRSAAADTQRDDDCCAGTASTAAVEMGPVDVSRGTFLFDGAHSPPLPSSKKQTAVSQTESSAGDDDGPSSSQSPNALLVRGVGDTCNATSTGAVAVPIPSASGLSAAEGEEGPLPLTLPLPLRSRAPTATTNAPFMASYGLAKARFSGLMGDGDMFPVDYRVLCRTEVLAAETRLEKLRRQRERRERRALERQEASARRALVFDASSGVVAGSTDAAPTTAWGSLMALAAASADAAQKAAQQRLEKEAAAEREREEANRLRVAAEAAAAAAAAAEGERLRRLAEEEDEAAAKRAAALAAEAEQQRLAAELLANKQRAEEEEEAAAALAKAAAEEAERQRRQREADEAAAAAAQAKKARAEAAEAEEAAERLRQQQLKAQQAEQEEEEAAAAAALAAALVLHERLAHQLKSVSTDEEPTARQSIAASAMREYAALCTQQQTAHSLCVLTFVEEPSRRAEITSEGESVGRNVLRVMFVDEMALAKQNYADRLRREKEEEDAKAAAAAAEALALQRRLSASQKRKDSLLRRSASSAPSPLDRSVADESYEIDSDELEDLYTDAIRKISNVGTTVVAAMGVMGARRRFLELRAQSAARKQAAAALASGAEEQTNSPSCAATAPSRSSAATAAVADAVRRTSYDEEIVDLSAISTTSATLRDA